MLKNNVNSIEPLLRDHSSILINLNSLKTTEINELKNENLVTGLIIEDLAQICRTAGACPFAKNLFFLVNNQHKNNVLVPQTLATLIWYYLEGFQFKEGEQPTFTQQRVINLNEVDSAFILGTDQAGRNWIKEEEMPDSDYIPCSPIEAEQIIQGHIPHRIWRYLFEH
jgi:hypothetical protein